MSCETGSRLLFNVNMTNGLKNFLKISMIISSLSTKMENQISPFWISYRNTSALIIQCVMEILWPWHHHISTPADVVHSRCSSRATFSCVTFASSPTANVSRQLSMMAPDIKKISLIKNLRIKVRHVVTILTK